MLRSLTVNRPTRTTSRTISTAFFVIFNEQQRLFSTATLQDSGNTNKSSNKHGQTHQETIPFYGLPRPDSSSASPSSLKQRLAVALKSASRAFRDPTRDDSVAALGEVTGTLALHRILEQMRNHPEGRDILRDRPIVDKYHVPYEAFLEQAEKINTTPADQITFGQAYGQFLSTHGFDPDERKPVQYIENPDLAYCMLRYRQCHDYWHSLTGLPPTILGELGLKWLELFQTGLPIAALSCTVGTLGLSYKQQHILWNIYLPWAIRVHKQQKTADVHGSLMTVYYEREFDTPLVELRERLKIEPAPNIGDEY